MSNYAWKSLKRTLLICLVAVGVLVLGAGGAQARPGDLDPSFSADGRAVHDVDPFGMPYSRAMTIDPQGRILVSGFYARGTEFWPALIRVMPDGSLDAEFGNGGIVLPQWGGMAMVNGIAVDGSGRIVLGGSLRTMIGDDFVVARLLGNGEPDPSFSGDGHLVLDSGGMAADYGSDLALDAQGRILLAGSSADRLVAVRITDSGIPDSSFDNDGIASTELDGRSAGEAVAVDPQGRIVVAGTFTVVDDKDFAVARFDGSGQPDASLGEDGLATLEFGVLDLNAQPADEVAADIAVDALGRLVLVGHTETFLPWSALVGRLLPDGSPDFSFAGDGRLTLPLGGANGVAIDAPGRILVVGTGSEVQGGDAFLARLGADGALDPGFGAGGVVREKFLLGSASGEAVAVDAAGRYVISGAGSSGVTPNKGFAVARYSSEDQPPIEPPRCRGKRATIVGTRGRDRLRGTRGRDVIVALGGNDRIRAFAGRDLICAGSGRDLVRAGKGNDRVFGGPGKDRLFGQAGKDRLRGGPGRDVER